MSKYIRTEDGIYLSKFVQFIHDGTHTIDVFGDIRKVLKQADTIKELCDGFWLESDRYDPVYIPTYIHLKERFDAFKNSDRKLGANELSTKTFYGSIYIKGKGWIHVAKLNNEGDLELI